MPTNDTDAQSARRIFHVLPWLILAGGLALTWLLVAQLRGRETEMAQAEFALRVSEVVGGLEHRLTANAQILRGVASLFMSGVEVTRDEFRRYADGLRLPVYYPGIQAIGYAVLVSAGETAQHVAAMRAQGLPDYAIWPPGDRDHYSAVAYVEPFDWRNQRAIGFDLFTEPVRSAAAARARDDNQVAMSDRVTLKQETDEDVQAGVLIFAPVYRAGLVLDTVAQRRLALRGWAYAAIRIRDVVDLSRLSHANIQLVRALAQQKQGEDALITAKDQAEAASRAKSIFLANMSHEIRTPLNAILGFAQVLARDTGLNAAQRDGLVTIQRGGEHLLTLINDILDLAKIEAGRMTLQVAPFDLHLLIAETETFFRQRARDRGLAITVETAAIPRMVAGDNTKLRQVLINLIGNAVKFTATGTVTLRVDTAPGDATGDRLRFSVTDTGPGIVPEELARLFKPFSQTDNGRRVPGGTGLGLALCTQYVRLMGGTLTVASTPGQGSCFTFSIALPSTATAAPAVVGVEDPAIGLAPGQPVCRVLIVDDLPDNRAPLRALLEALNPDPPVLEFREAADGRQAVAVWETWQPQVVFMDMRMPVLSGEEATRQIKARMAARPDAVQSVVVALTASAFDDNRDRFLACGCDEFARKPFRAEDLFAILERRVGLRFVRARERPQQVDWLSRDEVAARLAAGPDGWRADLQGAVAVGDFGRITALLEALRETDTALQATLAHWAYNYDLEAFSRALAGGSST